MIGSKLTKATAIALSVALISTSVLPVAQAEAGQRNWRNKHHKQRVVVRHHNQHVIVRHRGNRRNSGEALAVGIIGFALGAIIASEASRPRQPRVIYRPAYVQPQPVYVQPGYTNRRSMNDVYDNGPRVIRYEDSYGAEFEPWTPGWAKWCDENYRSFDVKNGTYRGYDGLDHFCVVK